MWTDFIFQLNLFGTFVVNRDSFYVGLFLAFAIFLFLSTLMTELLLPDYYGIIVNLEIRDQI